MTWWHMKQTFFWWFQVKYCRPMPLQGVNIRFQSRHTAPSFKRLLFTMVVECQQWSFSSHWSWWVNLVWMAMAFMKLSGYIEVVCPMFAEIFFQFSGFCSPCTLSRIAVISGSFARAPLLQKDWEGKGLTVWQLLWNNFFIGVTCPGLQYHPRSSEEADPLDSDWIGVKSQWLGFMALVSHWNYQNHSKFNFRFASKKSKPNSLIWLKIKQAKKRNQIKRCVFCKIVND